MKLARFLRFASSALVGFTAVLAGVGRKVDRRSPEVGKMRPRTFAIALAAVLLFLAGGSTSAWADAWSLDAYGVLVGPNPRYADLRSTFSYTNAGLVQNPTKPWWAGTIRPGLDANSLGTVSQVGPFDIYSYPVWHEGTGVVYNSPLDPSPYTGDGSPGDGGHRLWAVWKATYTGDAPTDLWSKRKWDVSVPDVTGTTGWSTLNWSTFAGFVGGGPSPYWTWDESSTWGTWSDSVYTSNPFKFDGGKTIYGLTALGIAPDSPDGSPLTASDLAPGWLSVQVQLYSGDPDAGGTMFGSFASGTVNVPEPATILLLGIGLAALGGGALRRYRRN